MKIKTSAQQNFEIKQEFFEKNHKFAIKRKLTILNNLNTAFSHEWQRKINTIRFRTIEDNEIGSRKYTFEEK